jgi:hypothetical protein
MPDFTLAVALLMSPVGTAEALPPAKCWPGLSAAIQAVAIDWQVLDVAERKYILADRKDFQLDLDIIRGRIVDYGHFPRVEEARRFPGRTDCRLALEFNRSYRSHLESLLPVCNDQAWEIRDAIREAERLYVAWDAVHDAQCDYYHATVRRVALENARKALGDDLFRAGAMPPFVPEWRFLERR